MAGTYPTTPPPHGIGPERLAWAIIETERDRVVVHRRRRIPVPLRVVPLHYRALSQSEFATLRTFYDQQRGRALRFSFTNPRSGESFQASFFAPLAWRIVPNIGLYEAVVEIIEVP